MHPSRPERHFDGIERDRFPSESIVAAIHWCFRSFPAARGCTGRRSTHGSRFLRSTPHDVQAPCRGPRSPICAGAPAAVSSQPGRHRGPTPIRNRTTPARSSQGGRIPVPILTWQMQQRGESAGAFDKRTHCGPAQPDDQTSFPMPWRFAISDFVWPRADGDVIGDESGAELLRSRPRLAQCSSGAQARHQLSIQRSTSFDAEGLLDRFVGNAHRLVVREVDRQAVGDLCRAHALAHRRSALRALLRPFHDANGPTTSPFSSRITPESLSCTYSREVRVQRVWLPWVALPQDRLSIAQLMCGTRACRRGWQRCGGVLARSSTVIAPIWSAISRMLIPFARSRAISSRSVKVRYLEGIAASIGSVGDAYDNALAESTIWVVQDRGSIEEKPVPERPARDHRRCRVRHDGMGRLVQPTPPPTAPWTTSHQTNSRRSTTVKNRLSARRCCKRRSGKKPGTVH